MSNRVDQESKIKLKFINAAELDNNIKATIHRTGKLGFTLNAAKKLDLKKGMSISIGQNEQDKKDKNLYIVVNDSMKEGAFKVCKAGEYFYLTCKGLFDELGYNYKNGKAAFDITRIQHTLYCMKPRFL